MQHVAHEALRRFKNRSLSPVDLMEATIRRAEALKTSINAFTYCHFDEAMDLARTAEAKYARGARTGALEGLPIGIKDESEIKGKPTSSGSLIMKDYVATQTSTVNGRVIAAGGIVHARTATPEFSCAGTTWSRLWGVTRNPWNTKFTCGGSSGGAAASLAAFATPAFAQENPAAADDDSGGIEEIIVTAQKREQNLQDVPVAVTAFSAATIAASVSDVAALTEAR